MAKKKSAKKAPTRKRTLKRTKEPHVYVMPKTAAELGIVCIANRNGSPCNLPVVWFDYQLGERNHMSGFVCDDHRVSTRIEKLAQPKENTASDSLP